MQYALPSLVVLMLTSPLAAADPAGPEARAARPAPVSVMVGGVEVNAAVTEDGRDVELSIGDGQPVRMALPAAGIVSELRLTHWMNVGIAMAVETRDAETNERSYFWSTAWVSGPDRRIGTPNVSRFLQSKVDYDLVGVVNSQGDSIYVTLLRHVRGDETPGVSGFVYVNNCPVSAVIEGQLHPLTAGPPLAGAAKDQP